MADRTPYAGAWADVSIPSEDPAFKDTIAISKYIKDLEKKDKNFGSMIEQAILDSQGASAQAGLNALPLLEAGTSASGLDSGIGAILNGSGSITGARQNAAGDYLSRVGLGNRANAVQGAGKMQLTDAYAIEDELNRRRQGLAGIGMTGMGVQSDALNAMGARGQTQALMRAQNKAQQRTQNMNMLGGLIGSLGNMNFSGGASTGTNASDYTGAAMQNWIGAQ